MVQDKLIKRIEFCNLRKTFDYNVGELSFTLEIDRTKYGKYEDFELEIELDSDFDSEGIISEIEGLFRKLYITVNYQNESKFARALKNIGSKPS